MLSIGDYLIILITNTSHKAHLLSYVLRCSSKLQEIQSLENFVSMAIQGIISTNVHKHTFFFFFFVVIFYIFQNFFLKKKKTEKQPNKNIKKHTKHKTRCKCVRKEEKEERSLHGDYTNGLA